MGAMRLATRSVLAVALLVAAGAAGWVLHSDHGATGQAHPSATARTLSPTATAPMAGALAVTFNAVVVEAGNVSAVLDVGTARRQLLRVRGIAWGAFRGHPHAIPPPKGTKVCVIAPITASVLRGAEINGAKVFVNAVCTEKPTGGKSSS